MIIDELKFNDQGLIPTVVQDDDNNDILMLAYMNRESLQMTLQTGKCTYFSRSRQKLWVKGETSGNFQHVKSILYDCDADTLLVRIRQEGVACHTGERSCFYRKIPLP
jgi:phosphoribosyl-AMP cyclohydrolase